ncbi:MAG TPA: restriction endonuclease subunit M [Prolixibacteraceae bacterium]|nr:restriction endonuclease subunit M [Prolixibacteraceae bacterium]
MSLFQKSVEKKYLNELDTTLVDSKYKVFQHYFGNPAIQENIRNAKEEQFQEGFLRELFVTILGYTLNPHPNFNLTTELKNIANSKKADGAILKGEDAVAVIELKGTDTTDLDKIETQAFGYKNHHPKCVYVITSNFEKLRFYIQNAVDHLDFDLFNLTREQFSLLWLCLAKDNLLNGLPQKIKESSVLQEENITKKLYADYSKFREAIYNNLVLNNPETDKLLLFRKTQKLIDRFLFIFFAEDRLLVPPNSISQIIEKWKDDVDFGDTKPLYDTFKKYFHVLNVGRPKSGNRQEIFAYNGGLFSEDEILDNINIDDTVLYEHTLKLSQYNYETDVDVNILGHIFEHSLGEIENVQAEIKGEKIDSQKTKRKKDGIFYTPKYITKYIVENTVGKLCEEKRAELGIIDEEYAKGRKNRKKETIKNLDDKLNDYRNWLLNLTILDPACGSGAFLNQALDFLITEHRKIDDLRAQLFGSGLVFSDITTDILEKNIYGVDINEESVEIAKLSLWLRTAQKGRKLNKLNNNIKCGNSLIDDPEVAGEKAFHWQNEFPEIFAKGGFDVVVGNPPYGATLDDLSKQFITSNFQCFKGNFDIYSAFIQLAFQICKRKGFWSFINPVSWQSGENYILLRQFLLQNGKLEIAIKLPYDVFEDAYVDTGIYVVRAINSIDYKSLVYEFPIRFKQLGDLSTDARLKKLPSQYWSELDSLKIVLNPAYYELLPKLFKNTIPLNDISDSIRGILPNDNDVSKINNSGNKLYFSGGLYRYKIERDFQYVNYGDHLKEKPKDYSFFQGERILIRRLINRQFQIMANYADDEFVNKKDLYNLKVTNDDYQIKYLLAIINSKLISFLKIRGATTATKDDFGQLTLSDIRQIPIKLANDKIQQEFSECVDLIIQQTNQFQKTQNQFHDLLQVKFNLEKLNQKLQNWNELSFSEFLKELQKAKIKLTLSEEAEWMHYFNEQKQKAQTLKSEIEKTDREIDRMVYALFGLTEEEIKIVEGAV